MGKVLAGYCLFLLITVFFLPQNSYAETLAKATSAKLATPSAQAGEDNRAKILKDYLEQRNSPLAGSSEAFVKAADENGIDWKLLVAISGVESTYGQQIPYYSYNAWGWGIYGTQTKYFSSWEEGISTISKGLRENYINRLKTDDIYAIGSMYAASPTWAQRVTGFMDQIEKFASNNPSYTLSLSL